MKNKRTADTIFLSTESSNFSKTAKGASPQVRVPGTLNSPKPSTSSASRKIGYAATPDSRHISADNTMTPSQNQSLLNQAAGAREAMNARESKGLEQNITGRSRQEKVYQTPPRVEDRDQLKIIKSISDDLNIERERNKQLVQKMNLMEETFTQLKNMKLGSKSPEGLPQRELNYKEVLESLELKIEELSNQNQTLSGYAEKAAGKIDKLKKSINVNKEENESLKRLVKGKESEIEVLQSKMKESLLTSSASPISNREYMSLRQELDNKNDILKTYKELEKASEDLVYENERVNILNVEMQKKCAILETQTNHNEKTIRHLEINLKENNIRYETELNLLRNKFSESETRKQSFEKEFEGLERLIYKANQEKDSERERANNLERKLLELEEVNLNINRELRKFRENSKFAKEKEVIVNDMLNNNSLADAVAQENEILKRTIAGYNNIVMGLGNQLMPRQGPFTPFPSITQVDTGKVVFDFKVIQELLNRYEMDLKDWAAKTRELENTIKLLNLEKENLTNHTFRNRDHINVLKEENLSLLQQLPYFIEAKESICRTENENNKLSGVIQDQFRAIADWKDKYQETVVKLVDAKSPARYKENVQDLEKKLIILIGENEKLNDLLAEKMILNDDHELLKSKTVLLLEENQRLLKDYSIKKGEAEYWQKKYLDSDK